MSPQYKVYFNIENATESKVISCYADNYESFLSAIRLNMREAEVVKKVCYQNAKDVITISNESEFKTFLKKFNIVLVFTGLDKANSSPSAAKVLPASEISSSVLDNSSCETPEPARKRKRFSLPFSDRLYDGFSTIAGIFSGAKNKAGNDNIPLHLAAEKGELNFVKYLVENRADIEAKSKENGETALQLASKNGHLNVIEYLVDNGADIDARDINGRTALHWASDKGHSNIVKYLGDKKADISAVDNDGSSALDISINAGHTEVTEELKKRASLENNSKDFTIELDAPNDIH